MRGVVVTTPRREGLMHAIAANLESRGAKVSIHSDVQFVPTAGIDFIVFGPKDLLSLKWANARQKLHTFVIPNPETTTKVIDRVSCRLLLKQAGLKMPAALASTAATLAGSISQIRKCGPPWVVKRRYEHGAPIANFEGLVAIEKHMKSMDEMTELVVEQKIFGDHFTVYFVGETIRMFSRPAFGTDDSEAFQSETLSDEILDNIRRFRKLTRLAFGKLDLVRSSDGGLFWVDVGVFPRFRQMSDAPSEIGRLVWKQAASTRQARGTSGLTSRHS